MLPHKDHHQRLVRRKRIKRSVVGLSRVPFDSTSRAQTRRLRPVGRNSHSRDWRREWPSLKAELERAGITRCERCGSDQMLTPAHSLKRRHITDRVQMREIALLCVPCHDHYELQGEAKMYPAIRAIIARRPDLLTEAA
jgi:hypothetical protein